jgi:type IV pilus assembly protein PilA
MLKQGFTLIELMVVIVIIGVLASLAIPRFTEASAKAKVAEAPRVLASYESAFLARLAETGKGPTDSSELIFEVPSSKWFVYKVIADSTPANLDKNLAAAVVLSAMGKLVSGDSLKTTYAGSTDDCFEHAAVQATAGTAEKMVPNFFNNGCTKPSGGGNGP